MLNKIRKDKKGFTLAELLIVVAIIAVLVAIAIPVFTSQLEKSREATDMANLRSGYAAAVTSFLENGSSASVDVPATQTIFGKWESATNNIIGTQIGSFAASISVAAPNSASGWTIAVDTSGSITVSAK